MTAKITMAFAACAVALLGFAIHTPTPAKPVKQPAPPTPAVLKEKDPLECVANTPIPFLLNPLAATEDGYRFQPSEREKAWKPEAPFDLSKPAPSEESVRNAIVSAVNYVLERQNENGGWDVELSGSFLSQTADHAVDAVAVTALCGLALRPHTKVNPEGINAALKKATDFIISRVVRGKLSTKVYYAVWRYSWGLKFLTGEYQGTKDPDRKDEIKSCAKRMVQALLGMQLSNSKTPRIDRKRTAKMAQRLKTPMPANMGLILALPTDEKFRGGAEITGVVPGSPAEKAGFKAGDNILNVEGVKIENAYDYYMMETEWVCGQSVQITFTRPGEKITTKEVKLPKIWPGYVGIKVGGGTGDGPVVEEFLKFSPSKKKLALGDVILGVGKDKIATIDDYRAAEAKIMPGDNVKFEVLRQGKKKSISIEATPAPEGTFGFYIVEEDKSDLGGVLIDEVPEESVAAAAGMQKGDRLMQIDHTPVLGLDHFIDYIATLAAARNVKCKLLRDNSEVEVECQLAPIALPGDMQFEIDFNNQWAPYVWSVQKGGVAEKAGVMQGMMITKINGTATPTIREFLPYWWNAGFAAGDEVTFTMCKPGGKENDYKIELQKPVYKEETLEVGGWAYYPDQGVAASFCSAATLINLYHVQQVMGFKIPKKECLEPAAAMLAGILHTDVTNGNVETWLYELRIKEGKEPQLAPLKDVRGCMGRNAVCELAMVIAGKRKKDDLKRTIDNWLKMRSELDKVRNFPGTHYRPLYSNAAYYWLFGHYYTCIAANYVGGGHKKKVQEVTLKALMLKKNEDGTWNDHEAFGPLVGTAEALMILGEIDGPFRDGYSATTQPSKEPEKKPEDGTSEGGN